ncbi:LacI family DNA-binding transcriptional regulator [Pricia sp. S334]|uniref:LacI family DNA-binding transcriptional regulator n=1 Tax=Pricia mediterranea TaxID=3076079 RepID=A0ABU3L9X3_9FLAO|nr:LacI family DNA-binding transcriptional regulator [Pricia sp. S334]MDT7830509.1 LacI family DNA-binding transcriptional regulator [Pricia sp. S334]
MKKTTIHEIAKALNINASTVSRALNDSERVKAKTKDMVLTKARELGYTRNMLASNLRRNKSNTIGVVVPRISRYFFSSTIAGIEEMAYQAGYNVIICQSLEEIDRERKIIRNLMANRVDGILISVSMETQDPTHLTECFENGTPLVFFDRHVAGTRQTGKVLIDDVQGGFEATEHLIGQGCRKIAHLTAPLDVEIYKNRHKGYQSALKKHKISYDKNLVLVSQLSKDDGYRQAAKIVEELEGVDGIFSANDFAAIGAMNYLKERDIKIPDDIAITGFSNEPTSAVIEPALTTVDQSGAEIGRLACNLLLDYFENGTALVNDKTIMLPPKLIVRDSTQRKNYAFEL